jgi:5'-3' exonuclease
MISPPTLRLIISCPDISALLIRSHCQTETALEIYLVDGTYELFRHYYALPSARDEDGHEVAAVRGVLASVLGMIKGGATHIAVATDHVIESFRNDLWPGYLPTPIPQS